MTVSVVIPIYNERDNIEPLYRRLNEVLRGLRRHYEILFVDDGSRDGGQRLLRALAADDPRVKLVLFRRNFGQTAALHAGLQTAAGDVVVTIDGDLQNDPTDIPMMLAKLDEGYDVVHGWRKDRKDHWLSRRLPSNAANWLISRATGFPIHDLGCTLKAIRRPFARELELYGEMHRFIPILAHRHGARCIEVVTKHHPRRAGKSKYGLGRTIRVVLDLITVMYMLQYYASPMKLFGMFGLGCAFVSVLSAMATLAMKLAGGVDMTGNPLLLLTALSAMISAQFLSLGLLGEVLARIYYGSQNKQDYAIAEVVHFDDGQIGGPHSTDPSRPARAA